LSIFKQNYIKYQIKQGKFTLLYIIEIVQAIICTKKINNWKNLKYATGTVGDKKRRHFSHLATKLISERNTVWIARLINEQSKISK
jgi:hypothetical protein